MKPKMSVQILDMIEERGGMTPSQIQKELWQMSHPGQTFGRENRGWWATNLYGPRGILGFYCEKRGRMWRRRTDRPHNGRPWKTKSDFHKGKVYSGPLFGQVPQ